MLTSVKLEGPKRRTPIHGYLSGRMHQNYGCWKATGLSARCPATIRQRRDCLRAASRRRDRSPDRQSSDNRWRRGGVGAPYGLFLPQHKLNTEAGEGALRPPHTPRVSAPAAARQKPRATSGIGGWLPNVEASPRSASQLVDAIGASAHSSSSRRTSPRKRHQAAIRSETRKAPSVGLPSMCRSIRSTGREEPRRGCPGCAHPNPPRCSHWASKPGGRSRPRPGGRTRHR